MSIHSYSIQIIIIFIVYIHYMQIGKLQLHVPRLSVFKKDNSDRTALKEKKRKEEKTPTISRRRTTGSEILQAAPSSPSFPPPPSFSHTFPIEDASTDKYHHLLKKEERPLKRQSLLTRALHRSSTSISSKLSPSTKASLSRKKSLSPETSRPEGRDIMAENESAVVKQEDNSDPLEKEIEKSLGRKRCISFGPPPDTAPHHHRHHKYFQHHKPRSASASAVLTAFIRPLTPKSKRRGENGDGDRTKPPADSEAVHRAYTYLLTSSSSVSGSIQAGDGHSVTDGAPLIGGLGSFEANETTSPSESNRNHGDEDWLIKDDDCREGDIITVEGCPSRDMAIRDPRKESEAGTGKEKEEDKEQQDDSSEASSVLSDIDDPAEDEFPWARSFVTVASTPEDCEPPRSGYRRLSIPEHAKPMSSSSVPGSEGQMSLPRSIGSEQFVCGLLDEDRPMEGTRNLNSPKIPLERQRPEAACLPQDIDPSFPVTTDTEDENYNESGDSFSEDASDSDRQSSPGMFSSDAMEYGGKIYPPSPSGRAQKSRRSESDRIGHGRRREHAPPHLNFSVSPPLPPVLPHTSSFTHTISDDLPRTPVPSEGLEDKERRVHSSHSTNPINIETTAAARQEKLKEKSSWLRLDHRREQNRISA